MQHDELRKYKELNLISFPQAEKLDQWKWTKWCVISLWFSMQKQFTFFYWFLTLWLTVLVSPALCPTTVRLCPTTGVRACVRSLTNESHFNLMEQLTVFNAALITYARSCSWRTEVRIIVVHSVQVLPIHLRPSRRRKLEVLRTLAWWRWL